MAYDINKGEVSDAPLKETITAEEKARRAEENERRFRAATDPIFAKLDAKYQHTSSAEVVDDAWKQYDEEKQAATDQPEHAEPTEVAAPIAALLPELPEQDPPLRQRGPRRPIAPRAMPHGNSTGVWIPREVWEDERFESTDERILYLEINHLDKEDGCTATNRHFAEYLGSSIQTIRDMIQDMTARGIFTCSHPSRRSRIIHIVGGRRDYSRHRF
jgi:hypothetical protein